MALAVLGLATAVRAAVTAFDPDLVSGEDAAMVAEQLGLTEKACAAARARAALRAAQCRSHGGRGFADASDWLAGAAGSSRARRRRPWPRRRRRGRLWWRASCRSSRSQVIARTEAECPGSEGQLLALARES